MVYLDKRGHLATSENEQIEPISFQSIGYVIRKHSINNTSVLKSFLYS